MPTFVIGVIFASLVIIRYLLVNNINKFFLKYFSLFILFFVISALFKWPNILWVLLMSVPLLNISVDKYIKTIFIASSILFIIVILLSFVGFLPFDYISFNGEAEIRYGIKRYSLGFDGPNQAAFSFFTILLSGFYTYGHKKSFVLLMTIITILIGVATGSRAGMVCSILFIIYYAFTQSRACAKKNKILPYLFVVCAVISYFTMTIFADNKIMNEVLTYRPQLINQYLNSDYIPKLFGTNAIYNKAEFQTPPLDNFSLYTLGKYGVLGFVSMAALFYIGIKKYPSSKLSAIFIFVMLYGMFEAFFDIPAKNFLLPIFFYYATNIKTKKGLSK